MLGKLRNLSKEGNEYEKEENCTARMYIAISDGVYGGRDVCVLLVNV